MDKKNKNMNKLQLITCVLLVFSIFVIIIGGNNLKNQIKELQTTVTRQANAIEQLEKQQNNTINYSSKNLNNIPNYD